MSSSSIRPAVSSRKALTIEAGTRIWFSTVIRASAHAFGGFTMLDEIVYRISFRLGQTVCKRYEQPSRTAEIGIEIAHGGFLGRLVRWPLQISSTRI